MKPIEDKCIPKNFWEEYSQEIKPALMKIDIATIGIYIPTSCCKAFKYYRK